MNSNCFNICPERFVYAVNPAAVPTIPKTIIIDNVELLVPLLLLLNDDDDDDFDDEADCGS